MTLANKSTTFPKEFIEIYVIYVYQCSVEGGIDNLSKYFKNMENINHISFS